MRILFLHLSDAHIKKDTDLYRINTKAIIKSLLQIGGFDECILIFSGDIAHSGKKEAYDVAGKLVGYVAKEISQRYLGGKYVHMIIVPGNHDNVMSNPNRDNIELESYYNSKEVDKRFFEDLKQLDNFYKFASRNRCFCKQKVIDIKWISFGNFSIRFNLINSAAFSLLGTGNRDKGMHYIPASELEKLKSNGSQKYTVSVIHHSPEWFSDASKHALYNAINESTDLLFVGHEHFGLNEEKKVNGNHIDVSSGIALYGTNTEYGFNALVLDTEAHTLLGYKYVFTDKFYKPSKVIDDKNVVFSCNSSFRITNDFQKELITDSKEREGENFISYFVFPSLEAKDNGSDLKNITINSEEKFLNLLWEKKKISIEGSSRTGKTILSKYISKKLLEDFNVLYLNEDSFAAKSHHSILRNAIQYEYGDNADVDEFMQLSIEKKILVVDGYDKVKTDRWAAFIKEYSEQFCYVILFCDIDWNLNIKDRTVDELTENAYYRLKICPFYYVKREELIKKICSNYARNNPSLDVEEKSHKINEDITSQIKYFQLTPDFIHQFVDYYLQFSHIKTQNDINVFSKVFAANITYRVSNKTKDDADVDEILVSLDYVAHYIHFVKQYQRIRFQEFEMAIDEYKKKYDNDEISAKYVYNVAINANIMKESSNSFEVEFCDENLLAYFVAQHLNRTCQMGENPNDLKKVLDNICFGINGDIILFLSYITSNTQILKPILQSVFAHMDKWEELNFDKGNIDYLSMNAIPTIVNIPEQKEKEQVKNRKNEIEKEIIIEKNNQAESLYSYDISKVNSFSNKIAKSINYLQLVAKILPNFRHILTGEEKAVITGMLYSYPNKLLHFMLKDIDENINKIIEEILKQEPKTRSGLIITEDMITKELQNQSMAYILSIYDAIAMTAATSKTIGDLEKFDFMKNTNYRIQNLMMQENVANFKLFSNRAEDLFDNSNLNMTKQMVILIVRKYFIYHSVEMHGDVVRLVDKFFGPAQRKKFQIQQAKNLIIKK